jgi:hypothetical protein
VAAREPYKDRVTGQITEGVTTGQIYWGAVPFVIIQCTMVAMVIAFPAMVMHYKALVPNVDPNKIEIRIPSIGEPGMPGSPNIPVPPFGIPPPSLPSAPPSMEGPPTAPSPAPSAPGKSSDAEPTSPSTTAGGATAAESPRPPAEAGGTGAPPDPKPN